MLKRFGDTPMTRRALLQAHGKATAEGLTPETYEKHLADEFAKWIGTEPDGDSAAVQGLGDAAAAVIPPTPPENNPSPEPVPVQADQTPPPLPRTTAALTAALASFAVTNVQNQGDSAHWGAGGPHPATWPTYPGTTTPSQTSSPADPSQATGLASKPQQQADWRIVGQILGQEIRKALDSLFKQQFEKAAGLQGTVPNPDSPSSPRGGVTLPRILSQMVGRLPRPLRDTAKKLGQAFSNSGVGRLARQGVVSFGRSKIGRSVTKALGSRLGGAGAAARSAGSAGGFGGAGKLAGGVAGVGMAVGFAVSAANQALDKGLQSIANSAGAPSRGVLYQASQQVPFLGPVVKFAQTLDKATDSLVSWNQQVGMFSASMTRVMAGREIAEINRSREMGDRLSPSAEALVEAEQRRKDSEMEYQIVGGEIQNRFGAILNTGLGKLLDIGKPALGVLEDMLGIQKEALAGKGEDLESVMNRVADYSKQTQDAAMKRIEKQRQLNGGKLG